jgi:hypothetical protein
LTSHFVDSVSGQLRSSESSWRRISFYPQVFVMTLPGPPYVGPYVVPAESVPDRSGVMGFMSHVTRDGDWVLPQLYRILSIMGQVDIDLTRIHIGPGTSEIEVRAIMGQVNIVVPHNLRVECTGDPMLGEFRVKRVSKAAPSAEAPLVRITGSAVMASVKVKVVDPSVPTLLDRFRAWHAGT